MCQEIEFHMNEVQDEISAQNYGKTFEKCGKVKVIRKYANNSKLHAKWHKWAFFFLYLWPQYLSRYSDWLRAGRSGDRIPMGGEIFRTCPDWPWGPPNLLYNGYRLSPGVKSGRGVTLTPHPFLVLWSRNIRIYLYCPCGPYSLYSASVPVQGCILLLPLPFSNTG